MADQPFLIHCRLSRGRNGFAIAWAEDWDKPFVIDRNMGRYARPGDAEQACVAVYGIFPHFHGIGF